jgi:nitrogen PTS system EIIA component
MHFGATLRLLRLESGLGLRDLARRLGVSSAYLSRVENGLDAAPTPARLQHLARELGVPAPLLVDLGQRVSPFVGDYIEQVPEAGSLFLEIAQRRLDREQLAELRALVEERFPRQPRAAAGPERRLSDLLAAERVILGLRCQGIEDALEIVAGRLAGALQGSNVAELAARLKDREREVPSAIGGGVAVPRAFLPAVQEAAALITFAAPLRYATPDNEPLRLLIVLAGPPDVAPRPLRLALVARLAARGLAEALSGVTSPARALAKLALLEGRG